MDLLKDGALVGAGGVVATVLKTLIERAYRASKEDRDDRSRFRLELMERITKLEARVETLEKERADLIERLAHKDVEIARLETELEQKTEELEMLSAANAELESELQRRSRAAGV